VVVELRLLVYFVAVADHRSIGRAANALGITQPTLSHQIRKLEALTGVDLFVRSTLGVTLTASGALLLEPARRVVDAAAEFDRHAEVSRATDSPVLRLGLVQNIPPNPLAAVFTGIRARNPGLRIDTVVNTTPDNLNAVRIGQLDAVIARGPLRLAPSLRVTELTRCQIGLLLSTDHRLASRTTIEPTELVARELIYYPRSWAPEAFERHAAELAEHGIDLHAAQQSHSIPQTLSTVMAGIGVALGAADWFPNTAGTIWRPLARPELTTTFAGVTRRGRRPSSVIRAFHETLRTAARPSTPNPEQ
jgi:DNA-binding transcriptional LysR family regulator